MRRWMYGCVVVFFALLTAAWLTHGRGIVRNDPARGIEIPTERTVPLQVKAAFDGQRIWVRYRWPTPKRNIEVDMLRHEGGKWIREGQAKSQGDYEDRIAMMVDDGSVPEFGRYGAYVMANARMWSSGDDGGEEEVAAHPYLGAKKGQREVGKYLPSTRQRPGDWSTVVPEPELARLRAAGYFVDLWQWHMNRTNPIGKADDGVIAEARYSDSGKGVLFSTNWDNKAGQPRWMLDPKKSGGRRALAWSEVTSGKLADVDTYLRQEDTVAFDAAQAWQDGDTIPRRVMRPSEGSAGDVTVHGTPVWANGLRDVTLTRALNTGHAQEDKAMLDKGVYTIAFGLHRTTDGSRFHYVSLPATLGLDREAQINAVAIPAGQTPAWEQPWSDITLFFPGRIAWATLSSAKHAGSKYIDKGVPVKFRHSERQLSHYSVEAVFADEIFSQWVWTLLAGLALIVGFGLALNLLLPRPGAQHEL